MSPDASSQEVVVAGIRKGFVPSPQYFMVVFPIAWAAAPSAQPKPVQLAERTTEHFILRSEAGEDPLAPMEVHLEETYANIWHYAKALEIPIQVPTVRMPVRLFGRPEAYDRFCQAHGVDAAGTPGLYLHKENVMVLFDFFQHPEIQRVTESIQELEEALRLARSEDSRSADRLRDQLSESRRLRNSLVERFHRLVVRHEAAHLILFNIGVLPRETTLPAWLAEGLACQFEVTRFVDGMPESNPDRLSDLRSAIGLAPGVTTCSEEQWRKAVDSGRLLELTELLIDESLLNPREANVPYRFAQSWSLVFFLRQGGRVRESAFVEYLRTLRRRPPGELISKNREREDFEASFGRPDAAFRRAWLDFITGLPSAPGRTNP
jgi:hypothetical protein